ncbi:MAG: formate-dependent phosphoribosylglycinamide formyltransferase [Mycobacterium sp.]
MTDGLTEGRHAATKAEAHARPRVILLGSDERGRQLAIALQHLGAEVIAVDECSDAPAHGVADQSLVITMTDADELLASIAGLHPDLVVSLADGISLEALDALAVGRNIEDHKFVELVPSARSVRITADPEGLRRLAADQLGLPTAPFWFVGSVGELKAVAAHAGYPLLVKPVAAVAGQGQSVVAGPEDVEAAWQRAVGRGPATAHRVLAETVVEVESFVTLLAVRSEGPNGPLIEFCAPIGHHDTDGDVLESWQPQKMSAAALDAAKSITARIVKALGGRGVFAVELMINGDEVYFAGATVGPRDSAWVTACSQRLSVFELQARAILGLPVDTVMISPGAARVIRPGHPTRGSSSAPGFVTLNRALAVPESDVQVFGAATGVALATAPDLETARDRARKVATALYMRDSRG